MARVVRQLALGSLLGRGGYGEVYLAMMRTSGGLESQVAVKVLHQEARSTAANRLRDEASLLFGLTHPVIVGAIDLVWIDGRPALVTEYVPGLDLDQFIVQRMAPPPRAMLEITVEIATALEAAHAQGGGAGPARVVHRDIKPSNIRIGRYGQVRLLDFGIAMFHEAERLSRTRTDLIVGSGPYMAPERFVSRDSGPSVDVFGLGCCLFEALVGERFHGDAKLRELTTRSLDGARYEAHRAEQLARLQRVPSALVDLIARMLTFDARERPTAAQVVDDGETVANALEGPTLKRWCHELDWPQQTQLTGRMTGRTLAGRTLLQREAPPRPRPDVRDIGDRGPRIIREAPVTKDPAMEPTVPLDRPPDEVETVATRRVALARKPAVPRRAARLIVGALLTAAAVTVAVASASLAVAVLTWLT